MSNIYSVQDKLEAKIATLTEVQKIYTQGTEKWFEVEKLILAYYNALVNSHRN